MSGFNTSFYQRSAFAGGVGDATAAENQVLTGANITPGSSGNTVVLLQQQLQAWGFSPGTIDGVYGPNTQAAVTALQRKLGLPASGIFDVQTQEGVTTDLQSASSVVRAIQASTLTTGMPSGGTATPATPAGATPATPAAAAAAVATSPLVIGGIAVAIAGVLYWWYRRRKKFTVASVHGVESIGDDLWPPERKRNRRSQRHALRAGQDRMRDCSARWKDGEGHRDRKAFMSECLKG